MERVLANNQPVSTLQIQSRGGISIDYLSFKQGSLMCPQNLQKMMRCSLYEFNVIIWLSRYVPMYMYQLCLTTQAGVPL